MTNQQPVDLGVIPTQGDDLQFTFTLVGAGDITGATVTSTIRPQGETVAVITAQALTIVTPNPSDGNPVVRATIADTTADGLKAPSFTEINGTITHEGDVLLVKTDSSEATYGPYQFAVRRRHT